MLAVDARDGHVNANEVKRRTVAARQAQGRRQRMLGEIRPIQRNQNRPAFSFVWVLHAAGPAFITGCPLGL